MTQRDTYINAAHLLRARWPDAAVAVEDDGESVRVMVGRLVVNVELIAGGWAAVARRRHREGAGVSDVHATANAACDEALRDLAHDMLREVDDAEAAARAVSLQVQALVDAPIYTTGRTAADGGE